jgi:pyruvate dehydrogenase E2 component (dihydrolipoamide acetyltransferase)
MNSDRRETVSGMRQTIARRLVESKQEIPHYQVSMVFPMDAMIDLRARLNTELVDQGVKLSVNDLLVRACALAMQKNPLMNASWDGDAIIYHGEVNVGVAVALPEDRGGGLVVPVIRGADMKSLRSISAETRALSEKARTRGLSVDDMSGATFTISNLGMFGVDAFTAIINPPNSAILAVGAALQKPVVRDGELAVGWEMNGTLSNDHRVVDGATAARYLGTLRELIEHPASILV